MNKRRQLLLASLAGTAGSIFAAESGVGDSEILLGQSAVLSGPLGPALQGFNAGARLAFEDANDRGGIAGRKLRLISLDDELKPERALANYKALLAEHKVFAFFGCVGSATTVAALPILKESNAPLIGNFALSDSAREKSSGAAYFVRATYGREATKLVQHLGTVGISRIAVAYLDNPGGQEVLAQIKAAVLAEGKVKDLAGAAAVKNDGSNAVEAGKALAAANAQAVVLFAGGAPVAQLMLTIGEAGASPSFYGMSVVPSDQVAKAMGAKMRGLATSQVVPYPWSESDPTARAFHKQCEAAKLPLAYHVYEGYLNGQVLLEGLRRAGRNLTRGSLHAAMHGLKTRIGGIDFDFTGGNATGSRFVELVHINSEGHYRR
ncbi:ABC transporter substrate-binding protein [Aquabacterium sp.]|uniref:ABC transporter substrate-binding protein n=1 Tax=Aquabacterium sp. TaxID=1872578 RepID=UPI002CDD08E0|nr:ABC transporter substrate-binding protein [Aquabacterium sp.]HSW06047.1 ABC transporter substrate-binding protein [Aquabacterium sp.]